MTQDNHRWRDKYRSAINQQEQLEKTLSAQQLLLHRAVSALSAAAEGHDAEMDQRLSALRSSLKSNDVGGFDRMIKSLSRITEEAEKRRQQRWNHVYKSFSGIADGLLSMNIHPDIKPAIKHYKKCIPKGELLPATIKRLLEEFTKLQTQAKNANNQTEKNHSSKGGFISKLFNQHSDKQDTEDTLTHTEKTDTISIGEWEAVDEITEHQDSHFLPRHRERAIPEAIMDYPIAEPSFSQISDRITIILLELLNHFPVVACVEQKANQARARIDRGLNWYELAPTLEDIRDFVIQSYIGADNDYRLYLKNVYGELSHITSALGVAIESEQQQRLASDTLHTDVSRGMKNIHQALAGHQEVDQLKSAVETQVHSIQHALDKFTQDTQESSLSDQLSSLIERVKQMEKQDADIRQQLEQEKTRAITDSLTGLPNREAYGEKVHDEMLRWQRYQHPLTLAVLDIDFFKKINDNYGHQTGDRVLKVVSQSVAKRLREVDFMARFGGEEFVLLLPETSINDALGMLDRTRERLAKTPLRYKEEKFTVTVSIGIAAFTDGDTAETVFARADKALYDAKEGGRNQCLTG